MSYKLGRQIYIEYQSYRYPGYYIQPATPIIDKVKNYTASVIGEILTDKEVEQRGVDFLSKLFTQPQTHEAAVILLKNVLKDDRFINEGKVFGVDLITNVIRTPQCQEDFKLLVINTLQREEVRIETVELLRYIIGRAEAEDIMAMYFKTIFLRDDLLGGVTNLLTKAAIETLDNPTTRDKFGNFALKIAGNDKVKNELYDNYIYKPAKRIFSLGLLSGNDDNNGKDIKATNNANGAQQ